MAHFLPFIHRQAQAYEQHCLGKVTRHEIGCRPTLRPPPKKAFLQALICGLYPRMKTNPQIQHQKTAKPRWKSVFGVTLVRPSRFTDGIQNDILSYEQGRIVDILATGQRVTSNGQRLAII
jgi:hypothetical protein